MAKWYEAGIIPQHTGATDAYSVTVTSASLVSPTVSTSRAWDITDNDAVTDVSGTILSGSASITTSLWTTPLITALTAGQRYRVETDISDSGTTKVFVLFVNCDY